MRIPILKLGTLAVRTMSKPIANKLKRGAGLHPAFRQVIVNIAQANHRLSTTIQRRLYSRAIDIEIRPLDEGKAIEAASSMLGELFIFVVAGAGIIYEVQRNSRSEARKEQLRKQEIEDYKKKHEEMTRELNILKEKVEELSRCNTRGYFNWFGYLSNQTQHTCQLR